MATAVRTARLTVDEFYNSPGIPEHAELADGEVRLVAPGSSGVATRRMTENATLDGGEVRPEFAVPVRDLFAGVV